MCHLCCSCRLVAAREEHIVADAGAVGSLIVAHHVLTYGRWAVVGDGSGNHASSTQKCINLARYYYYRDTKPGTNTHMRVARTRSVSDGVVMCRFSPVCCTYGPLAGPAVWQALSNASPNIFRMPLISHKYSYTSSCSCCCCCCCDCTPSDFD